MIGHCGGLRPSQRIGDYVLAHALSARRPYHGRRAAPGDPDPGDRRGPARARARRGDGFGPVGPTSSSAGCARGRSSPTDDRNWELRFSRSALRFSLSRAVGIDMESATIAGAGLSLPRALRHLAVRLGQAAPRRAQAPRPGQPLLRARDQRAYAHRHRSGRGAAPRRAQAPQPQAQGIQRAARSAETRLRRQIEPVGVHHLDPGRDEIVDELPPRVGRGHRPRKSRGAASSSRIPGRCGWPSISARRSRGRCRRRSRRPPDRPSFHAVPMSSRLTKKSLVSAPGRSGQHAVLRAAVVGAEHAQPADQHRHLRRAQPEQLGAVDQQLLGGDAERHRKIVAEASALGSSGSKLWASVCSWAASPRARGEGKPPRRSPPPSPPFRCRPTRRARSGRRC